MQRPSNQQGKTPPQVDQQGSDKLQQQPDQKNNPTAPKSNREEQRNQKQNQASQMSAADKGQSPRDRGDSAGGSGESLRQGALDAQYGTDSSKSGRTTDQAKPQSASNLESSEKSTGAQRDTLSGSRDSGRA
jgi:hypothetical protein